MPASILGTSGATFHASPDSAQIAVGTPTASAAGIANLTCGGPIKFTNGTASGQLNLVYNVAAQSVVSGTPVNVTINNGSVNDALNEPLTFATVKAITVSAPTTNTAAILCTGTALSAILGAATSLNPGITLNPGSVFTFADPLGVSVSSAGVFTFTAVTGTQAAAFLIAGK